MWCRRSFQSSMPSKTTTTTTGNVHDVRTNTGTIDSSRTGPGRRFFLFAGDAPASTADSIPSNTTTIPAEVPVPPRTDLGYFSPSGAASGINRLPHGYSDAGGPQGPWLQTPTQAVHMENVTQLPNLLPFPMGVNILPSVGPQDATTTYPILSQFSYVENMRSERLRQKSRALGGASSSQHPWDSAQVVTGLGQPSQLPAQLSPAIDAHITGIHETQT